MLSFVFSAHYAICGAASSVPLYIKFFDVKELIIMAKATKEETKVIEMENKIEKMTQFLADNKIECFDIQKLEDEQHTTIFRSRMEVKGQLLPMALLMDDSV